MQDLNETLLVQWVIYERPADYPEWFVIRQWRIKRGEIEMHRAACLCATLAEARASIPPGMFCLGRMPDDDPAILEVWT